MPGAASAAIACLYLRRRSTHLLLFLLLRSTYPASLSTIRKYGKRESRLLVCTCKSYLCVSLARCLDLSGWDALLGSKKIRIANQTATGFRYFCRVTSGRTRRLNSKEIITWSSYVYRVHGQICVVARTTGTFDITIDNIGIG